MSKRRGVVAVTLTACMLLAIPAIGFADEAPWYQGAVEYVVDEGLMAESAADFAPAEQMKEKDFATALYKASGQTGDEQAILEWAKANNLTTHITWDDCLTREEMMEMLHQGLKANGQGPSGTWAMELPYSDKAELADWAVEAAMDCTNQHLIVGEPEGRLAPQAVSTRAEAAVVIERFDRLLKDKADVQLQALFDKAVEDVQTIEPDEILPVTAITKDSPMVTWNDAADRVLLLTFHKYPDSYQTGQTVTTQWGEVWTFTDREIEAWYDKNGADVKAWPLRLRQLIGLRPDNAYTHISALWVKPEDIIRPAYETDITKNQMTDHFSDQVDADFKAWFEANEENSYHSEYPYPWTRLGYTYDWADNGQAFGLSEFLIKKNAAVEVEFTKTIDEFIDWLNTETAADAA